MVNTVFYEPIKEEEILFQPQGMSVQYVNRYEFLNTREAWEQAFKADHIKVLKINKCSITLRHGSKNRRMKILTHVDNTYIRFLSMGQFHYMRPIYYKGKIVLNHYREDKEECYPITLSDEQYREDVGFFCNNPEDERYGSFIEEEL